MVWKRRDSLLYHLALLLLLNGVSSQRSGGLLQPIGEREGSPLPSYTTTKVDNTRPLLQPFTGNLYNTHTTSSRRPPPGASQGSFYQGQGPTYQFQSTGSLGGGVTTSPEVGVGGSGGKAPPPIGGFNAPQNDLGGSIGGSLGGPPTAPPAFAGNNPQIPGHVDPNNNNGNNNDQSGLLLGGLGGGLFQSTPGKAEAQGAPPGSGNPSRPNQPGGNNAASTQVYPVATLVLILPLLLPLLLPPLDATPRYS